ncbi:MAG: phosphoribosylformylglycinamidine cyclo-ligase [Pseudomonadota bacterium]
MAKTPLTYKDAGVDIDAGNRLVDRIGPLVAATQRPEVLAELGGFGSLFALDRTRFPEPVLVAGTDGVGTKLLLAREYGADERIGIDLVAMCVNDVIAQGAEPLFFLDYFACGALNVDQAAAVISGIARGCRQAGCALIGGETAEMPGMYARGDYDLAGFCVGAVNRSAIIDGNRVAVGDTLIGLGASGPHANGYSLIRRIVELADNPRDIELGSGIGLVDALLEPTRIYATAIAALIASTDVRGIAHITGGGLPENVPRMLPDGCVARLFRDRWPRPPVFDWLQATGNVTDEEMLRTFNCGLGMVMVVPRGSAEQALKVLRQNDVDAWQIGRIEAGERGTQIA